MIEGFELAQERNFYFLGSKGVDEGLTSLYLHCLGIETMPVHRQHSPFKSILYEVAVSFSSSSLKRRTALARIKYHKENQVKTKFNIEIGREINQDKRMQCINDYDKINRV